MLAKLYTQACEGFPKFRKFTRKHMYQILAKLYQKEDWSFMNYGYSPLQQEDAEPILASQDEVNRTCIQLYYHLASAVDLSDRNVLEIGSGRGGGAYFIKRYFSPKNMVGLDFSNRAVSLCKQHYKLEGLSFIPGDAEALPFNDATFDAVVNVESSHCYASMSRFLAQVKRVLKPGGHFLFADFRNKVQMKEMNHHLEQSGLHPLRFKDISLNVLKALEVDHDRRANEIQKNSPAILKQLVREFAGVKGTTFYNHLMSGHVLYHSHILQNPVSI
jgi:ubiquinone/menaquinone biosynthesis C-methylase UbiE